MITEDVEANCKDHRRSQWRVVIECCLDDYNFNNCYQLRISWGLGSDNGDQRWHFQITKTTAHILHNDSTANNSSAVTITWYCSRQLDHDGGGHGGGGQGKSFSKDGDFVNYRLGHLNFCGHRVTIQTCLGGILKQDYTLNSLRNTSNYVCQKMFSYFRYF